MVEVTVEVTEVNAHEHNALTNPAPTYTHPHTSHQRARTYTPIRRTSRLRLRVTPAHPRTRTHDARTHLHALTRICPSRTHALRTHTLAAHLTVHRQISTTHRTITTFCLKDLDCNDIPPYHCSVSRTNDGIQNFTHHAKRTNNPCRAAEGSKESYQFTRIGSYGAARITCS